MRNLLALGKKKVEEDMDDEQPATNAEIFAQLLAIFGTVNDLALEVTLLRQEIRDLRPGLKDQHGSGSVQTPQVRAIGSFASEANSR